MNYRYRFLVTLLALFACSELSHAALIRNAKAKTSGRVTITTNTKGQRQIAITIDPDAVLAFQLDVVYEPGLVTPAAFDGFTPGLTEEAVQFVPPYGGAIGGGASILPGVPGLISNVSGQYIFPPGFAGTIPQPNNPDGSNDLFTLFFIDNDPTADKTFTILGVDTKGIDPDYARFISDNYLDVFVPDPNDPAGGQTVRYTGDQIEAATIFIPGITKGGGSSVPLPLSVMSGAIGAALVALKVRKGRRTTVDNCQ
jgi:hypothetical protein